MASDLKLLLTVNDRVIAEEVQQHLEKSNIYTLLESDNPASSAMGIYTGQNQHESINIIIHQDAYHKAIDLLKETPYSSLISFC